MKLILTQKGDGKLLIVESEQIKLIESDGAGGSHIVFGADLGRIVNESPEQIALVLGAARVV